MTQLTDTINRKLREKLMGKHVVADAYLYRLAADGVHVTLLSAFEEVRNGKFFFSLEELKGS